MDQDLEELEEKLKQQKKTKREIKKSGRSVFKLQEIIKKKASQKKSKEDST